jgi:hypothetical protein
MSYLGKRQSVHDLTGKMQPVSMPYIQKRRPGGQPCLTGKKAARWSTMSSCKRDVKEAASHVFAGKEVASPCLTKKLQPAHALPRKEAARRPAISSLEKKPPALVFAGNEASSPCLILKRGGQAANHHVFTGKEVPSPCLTRKDAARPCLAARRPTMSSLEKRRPAMSSLKKASQPCLRWKRGGQSMSSLEKR